MTYKGKHVKLVPMMTSKDLNNEILGSKIIVARSGYTNVMDLCFLRKKAVLVPTPGQTEQEYWANRLKEKGYFYSQTQEEFNLKDALNEIENYNVPQTFMYDNEAFKPVLERFLGSL